MNEVDNNHSRLIVIGKYKQTVLDKENPPQQSLRKVVLIYFS